MSGPKANRSPEDHEHQHEQTSASGFIHDEDGKQHGRISTIPTGSGCSEDTFLAGLSRLETVLCGIAERSRFALAYSGGLDSRFIAHTAQRLGIEPRLMHVVGPHMPPEETAYARDWANSHSFIYEEVCVDPLDLPLVASGDRRRCYACKHALFSMLKLRTHLPLCDGTNASDIGQYRPGIQAVEELGILSPLALAGMGKDDIRSGAFLTGMEDSEQKARPCLLTRLPYGMKPERKLLAAIDAGERAARRFFSSAGQPEPDFRLRLVAAGRTELHFLPDSIASLSPGMREELIHRVFKAAGDLPSPRIVSVERLSGFFDGPA
jgi:pyridinium-3,5-biscarboxylic acid mononucleotide sulfurtransferase